MIFVTLLATFALAAGAQAQSLNLNFSCPPNTNTATTHAISVVAQQTVTCQVQLGTIGVVQNVVISLALPTTGPVPLVTTLPLPDGLPDYQRNIVNPVTAEWRFGDPQASLFTPRPKAGSSAGAGTWDAATRSFKWTLQSIGVPNSASSLELQMEFVIPNGLPSSTNQLRAELTTNVDGTELTSLARSLVMNIAPRAAPAPTVNAPPYAAIGGKFLVWVDVGGTAMATADPQTNATAELQLPYWDPSGSGDMKADGNYNASAGHVPIADHDSLELKLIPTKSGATLPPLYMKPTGTDVGPADGSLNAGRLIKLDRAKNTVTLNIGTVAAPYFPDWYAVLRSNLTTPAGVSAAALVNRAVPFRACLRSDQAPASANRCNALAAGNHVLLAANDPTLLPSIKIDNLRGSNNASGVCETVPFTPSENGSTKVSIDSKSSSSFTNFALVVQVPGTSTKNTNLGDISLGTATALNADVAAWNPFTLGLSTGSADYGSLSNLLARTLPGAAASFTTCPRSSPAFCTTANAASAGVTSANVQEIRLSAPVFDPPAWRHARTSSNADQIQFAWSRAANAPTASTIDGGSCNSGTSCTNAAYCAAAKLTTAEGQPVVVSTVSDVTVASTYNLLAGGRRTAMDSFARLDFASSLNLLDTYSYVVRIHNTGQTSGLTGPFEVETTLPANVELTWKKDVIPALTTGRTPAVEQYGDYFNDYAKASNVVVTQTPLNDGTGRTRVKLVVNAVEDGNGVPQVLNGRPVLHGTNVPSIMATRALNLNLRIRFLPGVAQQAFVENTVVRFQKDGIETEEHRHNTTATRYPYTITPGAPAPSLVTYPRRANGTSTGKETTIDAKEEFSFGLEFTNASYLEDGSDVAPFGSRGPANRSVLYQRVPLITDTTTTPKPLLPEFVAARGLKRTEFSTNDLVAIWVNARELDENTLGDTLTLTATNGWVRCAVPDANGLLECNRAKALADLSGSRPRWIGYEIGTALITDAAPRGQLPINGATRIDRPYAAGLYLKDLGSARGSRVSTTSVQMGSNIQRAISRDATIIVGNTPPIWTPVAQQTVRETDSLTFDVKAADQNQGDEITYAIDESTLPEGASFDAAAGRFTWTPGFEQSGTFDVKFTAGDGVATTPLTVRVVVENVNRAPTLSASSQTTFEQDDLSFAVEASDPDRQKVVVTCADMPPGMTYDDETRTFTWKPTRASVGRHTLTIVATDPEGAKDTKVVTVTVNGQPQWVSTPRQTVAETSTLTFVIRATDDEDDALTYDADKTTIPRGAIFDPATRTLTWTPDNEQSGQYTLAFGVTDGINFPTRQTVEIQVDNVNRPPVLTVADQRVVEGRSLTFTVTTRDDDLEPVTVTVPDLPKGMTYDDATRTFRWDTSVGMVGVYRVNPVASDTAGGRDPKVVTIVVARDGRRPVVDPLPPVVVAEGREVAFTVVARDPDLDPFVLSLEPAGALPAMEFDALTGAFRWTPGPHDQGPRQLTFKAEDQDGATTVTAEVYVLDINLPPAFELPEPPEVNEGSELRLTLVASDPDEDVVTFDIENLPAGATFAPTSGLLTWKPTNSQSGVYELRLLAIDRRGGLGTGTLRITVLDLDAPPELQALESAVVDENQLLAIVVTASDPDLDPIALTAIGLPEGAQFDAPNRRFSWRPAFGQKGEYDVTFEATSRGRTVSTALHVTVRPVNRPPVMRDVEEKRIQIETTVTFTVGAEDPDGDPVTCELMTESAPIDAKFDPAKNEFRWTPGLLEAGEYPVSFRCTDSRGASDEVSTVIRVVEREYRRVGGGLASRLGCTSADAAPLALLALALLGQRRRRRAP